LEGHGGTGPAWAALVERSALGEALRGSTWLYPAVECLHIVGFALLVGAIASFDVRTLRAASGPATEGAALAAQVLPVARAGFALAAPMGLLLFATEATAYVGNPAFLAKLGLVALALLNVAWFHARLAAARRGRAGGEGALRLGAALSLALWVGAVVAGRLIAYV
jgi:hypothetical protein